MTLGIAEREKLTNNNFVSDVVPWVDKSTGSGGSGWVAGELVMTAPQFDTAHAEYAVTANQPPDYPILGNLAPSVECTLEFDVKALVQMTSSVIVGTTSGGSDILSQAISSTGVKTFTFTTSATVIYIRIGGSAPLAPSGSIAIDDIFLKQKLGGASFTVVNS